MYATSHKRPFVSSVGGIVLLCNVLAQGPVSFCETSAKATNGKLIHLDGSRNFFETFVARGRKF